MVEVAGFEPATKCFQGTYADRAALHLYNFAGMLIQIHYPFLTERRGFEPRPPAVWLDQVDSNHYREPLQDPALPLELWSKDWAVDSSLNCQGSFACFGGRRQRQSLTKMSRLVAGQPRRPFPSFEPEQAIAGLDFDAESIRLCIVCVG